MKKKDPITLHYRLGNERNFLNSILEKNEKVTIRRTNYSLKVETERRNYLFSSGAGVSRKAFAGYNKILSDIKKSGLEVPDVTARDVKYWWFDEGREYPANFNSVDINAAYPTALYRVGAITKKTYRYLIDEIPKSDRLRCVGMLATQKGVYHYENGQLVDFEVDKSDYSGWFFMCASSLATLWTSADCATRIRSYTIGSMALLWRVTLWIVFASSSILDTKVRWSQ